MRQPGQIDDVAFHGHEGDAHFRLVQPPAPLSQLAAVEFEKIADNFPEIAVHPDVTVDLGRNAIDGDHDLVHIQVDQGLGDGRGEQRAIGGHLHPGADAFGQLDGFQKVGIGHGLAVAAKVDGGRLREVP